MKKTEKRTPFLFMDKPMTWKRIIVYIAGLYIMTLGIAFAVNSHFGVSPVTTLPYVCGKIFGITIGQGTYIAYTLYIIIELIVYRKQFKPVYLLQFGAAVLFGWFTDINKALVPELTTIPLDQPLQYFTEPKLLVFRILFTMIGIVILGLGLCGYLIADIMAIPPDAMAVAFSWLVKKPLGNVKRICDLCIVASSLILNLAFNHTYEGIFIGTIMAALGVGTFHNFWSRIVAGPLKMWLYGLPEEDDSEELADAV